jgi:hypothetical protein
MEFGLCHWVHRSAVVLQAAIFVDSPHLRVSYSRQNLVFTIFVISGPLPTWQFVSLNLLQFMQIVAVI